MKVLSPRWSSSAWESGTRRRSPLGVWLWRPVGLDHRKSTGLGETETPLLEGIHFSSCILQPREKAVTSQKLGQTWLLLLESLLGKQGTAVAYVGTKTLVVVVLGRTHLCELSSRPPVFIYFLKKNTFIQICVSWSSFWKTKTKTNNKTLCEFFILENIEEN